MWKIKSTLTTRQSYRPTIRVNGVPAGCQVLWQRYDRWVKAVIRLFSGVASRVRDQRWWNRTATCISTEINELRITLTNSVRYLVLICLNITKNIIRRQKVRRTRFDDLLDISLLRKKGELYNYYWMFFFSHILNFFLRRGKTTSQLRRHLCFQYTGYYRPV